MKVFLTACVLTCLVGTAQAWSIEKFEVEAIIKSNGVVSVQEKIVADFSQSPGKHGIIREIPQDYVDENGKPFTTPYKNIVVTDAAKRSRNVEVSKSGSFLSLRIGDAQRFVGLKEIYLINYEVEGVINAFENHDEFYWNVTGNNWDARIESASLRVMLETPTQNIQMACYTGTTNSKASACDTAKTQNNQGAQFTTQSWLLPGEGLTAVFGFDKGLVELPVREYTTDYKALFFKFAWLLLLGPIVAIYFGFKQRRAVKVDKPVIPVYEPPADLSLSEIGFLNDHEVNTTDLIALIISLCVKGHLKIEEIPKSGLWGKTDFKLIKQEADLATLEDMEKWVLEKLFKTGAHTMLLSESNFKSATFNTFLVKTKQSAAKKGYLNEESTFFTAALVATILIVPMGIMPWATLMSSSLVLLFLIPIGVVILSLQIWRTIRPKKTKLGMEKLHETKCFREYLNTAEKDQINWSEAQNLFEKNLPYAIALDLTEKWTNLFGDRIVIPTWYQSDDEDLNLPVFSKRLSQLDSNFQKVTTPPPSTGSSRGSSGFGGGGSSGGGFGGGGGRSW